MTASTSPAAEIELAGVALSRECYRLVKDRAYSVTLLCGGSRIPFDLTGLVGADLHATINWSTFAEVLASEEPFTPGIDVPIDTEILHRLEATFDDVRRAMRLGSLSVEEFDAFGPVQHFRNNFIVGVEFGPRSDSCGPDGRRSRLTPQAIACALTDRDPPGTIRSRISDASSCTESTTPMPQPGLRLTCQVFLASSFYPAVINRMIGTGASL